MLKIIASARYRVGLVVLMAGFGVAGAAVAGPIGYLQIEGNIEVMSPGDREAVRVKENNFTVFSGDQFSTHQGAAVLVLTGGGTLGFGPGSEVRVSREQRSGRFDVDLHEGTLLYSLPGHFGKFVVRSGEFRLYTSAGEEREVRVERNDSQEYSGMIERLENGHVRVSVRNGQMEVHGDGGSRYLVAAGNEIGLLAGNTEIKQVNLEESSTGLVKIESPEKVDTGETFRIRWDMPDPPEEGYITIAPAGSDHETFESLASITQGREIEFRAPGMAGDYEIRYVDAESGLVTNFVYLQVVGDRAVVPWYTTNTAIAGMGFLGGLTTSLLICDCDDDDPDPPSP